MRAAVATSPLDGETLKSMRPAQPSRASWVYAIDWKDSR
jgi:hypothetical protein